MLLYLASCLTVPLKCTGQVGKLYVNSPDQHLKNEWLLGGINETVIFCKSIIIQWEGKKLFSTNTNTK